MRFYLFGKNTIKYIYDKTANLKAIISLTLVIYLALGISCFVKVVIILFKEIISFYNSNISIIISSTLGNSKRDIFLMFIFGIGIAF